MSLSEYRIGKDDELEISVYGDDNLAKTQRVRPDGKIAFPLIGDIKASGATPDELREQVTQRLSKYLRNPQVTVIVSKYNSKQVFVLGQVKTPGVLFLSSDINVLQGVARAGGVTEEADLHGALLIRDARVVPVNFDKLLRSGDFTQNILLRPNDAILIPNVSAKKIFVLGEVKQSLAIALRNPVTLIEAISMAGGFTSDAESQNVVVVRGGLGADNILNVNVDDITSQGLLAKNMPLQPNDIVYVPKSFIAEVGYFAEKISKILTPIILTEFGISLYPTVKEVIKTGKNTQSQTLIPQPQP
jgi:polysaccharide export outer membrane protein